MNSMYVFEIEHDKPHALPDEQNIHKLEVSKYGDQSVVCSIYCLSTEGPQKNQFQDFFYFFCANKQLLQ